MFSTFTWLDYSEYERRKMLDAIALFDEPNTRDELGLGGVRDAFADQLFPGTNTIQTRAKYFLFIPWIYLILERKQTSSAEVEKEDRKLETKLILSLLESEDKDGIIGKQKKDNLLRLPSSIYWHGLRTWGIRHFPGSQDDYHRSLDLFYLRWHNRRASRREFEGEAEDEPDRHNWHSELPSVPDNFPREASLALTQPEAVYLREQIMSHCRDSLLAVLVRDRISVDGVNYAWELTASLPPAVRELLDHGENFSQIMHGAQLLYNLMLAEIVRREDLIDDYRNRLGNWWEQIQTRGQQLREWNRQRFWHLVGQGNSRVPIPAKQFVNDWVNLALGAKTQAEVVENIAARNRIEMREAQLKREQARLHNKHAQERWLGASGAGQMDLRWNRAQRIVADILTGLENTGHA
ncbi:MAG: DUF6361 family protein [Gemmataceae bacterium]